MKNNFKKELKDLLVKYGASIGFVCGEGSDTYGLYDAHIVIEINDKEVVESDGWWLCAEDI